MTVLLNRAYGAYPAGAIVELPATTEAAIIAQGIGQNSAGPVTSGAQSSNEFAGTAAVPAGQSSVVITNPWITANAKLWAVVAQAAADATALRVERIVCAAGAATIYVTANATAATTIDWAILSCGLAPTL
jgi:hypothetical protein